jgi:thymidylate synthase
MKQYLDIARNILDKGEWKGNRTGIRTKVLPNQFFSHDMSHGFPLLTTKKVAFKTMATELEGFIKGVTSKQWYQDRGCHIWDEWCNNEQLPKKMIMLDKNENEIWEYISDTEKQNWQKKNPDLGPLGYSHGWRNFNGDYTPVPFIWTDLDKTIDIQYESEPSDRPVGKEIEGKYGVYTVISYDGKDKYHNDRYSVKFHNSGFIKDNLNLSQVMKGKVFDIYYPNICGVACVGDYSFFQDPVMLEKLKSQWRQMIHRCYNKKHCLYKKYGAKGIYVENRWLIFANFLEDIQSLEGWNHKLECWSDYQLDKDIKEKKYYGKESCVWCNRSENSNYTSQNYIFDAVSPKGIVYKNNIGLARFCRQHNLKTKIVEASIKNNSNTHHGWKFIRHKNLDTHTKRGIDQFDNIIKTLKTNPDDRRIVCSAWNPVQLSRMALPPCHLLWVLTHINGKLHLHWTQRSCDMFLGVPFNIASYGLLLVLICKETGLIPGNLSGTLCDCHIYEDHIDKFKIQLSRPPKDLSQIEFRDWNGIYNWKATDMKLTDYDPYPTIRAKVAV